LDVIKHESCENLEELETIFDATILLKLEYPTMERKAYTSISTHSALTYTCYIRN